MVQEMIGGLIEGALAQLLSTAQATPDDKMNWKPLDNGRTALDLLGDAAQTAAMTEKMLATKGEFKPSREEFMKLKGERAAWTRDEATQKLQDNTAKLLATLRATSEDDLAQPLHLSIGGGMTMPLGGWVMMVYRTFVSRMAQINYIQTLYGDFESH